MAPRAYPAQQAPKSRGRSATTSPLPSPPLPSASPVDPAGEASKYEGVTPRASLPGIWDSLTARQQQQVQADLESAPRDDTRGAWNRGVATRDALAAIAADVASKDASDARSCPKTGLDRLHLRTWTAGDRGPTSGYVVAPSGQAAVTREQALAESVRLRRLAHGLRQGARWARADRYQAPDGTLEIKSGPMLSRRSPDHATHGADRTNDLDSINASGGAHRDQQAESIGKLASGGAPGVAVQRGKARVDTGIGNTAHLPLTDLGIHVASGLDRARSPVVDRSKGRRKSKSRRKRGGRRRKASGKIRAS